MSDSAITLHGTRMSGHTHRVELMLRMLNLPFVYRDTPAAVRAAPGFLALNPLGQIPVLEDGGLVLADSNAILVYLARRYDPAGRWLPESPEGAAAVQRWLSIAAGEVSFGPAAARAIALWSMRPDIDAERAKATAARLLAFMEEHLAAPRQFLAAGHATLADLACYSYVACAPEGGIALDPHLAVRAWLARIEALPHFEPMPRSHVPVVA